AGVLVGDAHLHLARRFGEAGLGQELEEVARLRSERVVEILQVGGAAGRVDDQEVEVLGGEGGAVQLAESARRLQVPVVREERAAAELPGREPDLAARDLE